MFNVCIPALIGVAICFEQPLLLFFTSLLMRCDIVSMQRTATAVLHAHVQQIPANALGVEQVSDHDIKQWQN